MRITTTGVLYDDPARSTPGYVLIRPSEGNKAFLVDPDGAVAHEWTTGYGITNWTYLLPNGHLFANEYAPERKGVALTGSGRMTEYDARSRLVWQHDDPYQHHDMRRLEDGAIYAAYTELSEAEKALHFRGDAGGGYRARVREPSLCAVTAIRQAQLDVPLSLVCRGFAGN